MRLLIRAFGSSGGLALVNAHIYILGLPVNVSQIRQGVLRTPQAAAHLLGKQSAGETFPGGLPDNTGGIASSSLKRPKTGSAPGRGEIRIAKAPDSPDTCLAVCRRVRSAARVRVDHADHMGRYAPRLCYRADRHRSPRPPPPALRLASAALPELQSTRRYRWRTCSLLPRSVDMTMYIG